MGPFAYYTVSQPVRVLTYEGLQHLLSELNFGDVADLAPDSGPFVYVLRAPGTNGVMYVGKSDATSKKAGARALSYARWQADYQAAVAGSGRLDPIYDPEHGDLKLLWWAPIIRFCALNALTVKVADVSHTNESGAVWEARIKALCSAYTGLESVVGASGWEVKEGTLRDEAYRWAIDRITEQRKLDAAAR